jgi:hypothetical protein
MEELNQSLSRLGQAVYSGAGTAGGPGGQGPSGGSGPSGTVEGEFREV